jgi:hypothetical protein
MKLHEIAGRHGTLTDEEWEDGVDQLKLLKDIADTKSSKPFIVEMVNNNGREQCNVMTDGDIDGYPSICLSKMVTWNTPVEHIPHYFVFRQASKALGVSAVVENHADQLVAIKRFFTLLKDVP